MNKHAIDTIIEKTVIPSFSRIGLKSRRRLFRWRALTDYSMTNKVVVLTGGTSGIGEAAAAQYAAWGARLILIGRDPQKTQQKAEQLNRLSAKKSVEVVIGDLGRQDDVHQIAKELTQRVSHIDVLAHNAGALFNQRQTAENGTDLSVELMVATPYLLTGLLLPLLRASSDQRSTNQASPGHAPSRVLTMSSGGMYTEPLSVQTLEMTDAQYQGAKQYARAKRAQVVLNECWADRISAEDVIFHALHPGWVHTPGIVEALPLFSKVLGPLGLLRTPAEGADTLLWLSADSTIGTTTGKFWHDRAARSIDMSQKTKQADTPNERLALWQWCEQHTGWQLDQSLPLKATNKS